MMFPLHPLMKYPSLVLVLLVALLAAQPLQAQLFQGHFDDPAAADRQLLLSQARGGGFHAIDSVRVGPTGDFDFQRKFLATGFYNLALNDSDRVDLILDAHEPLVYLQFDSLPMDEHLHVRTSDENKRLWEFKYISRETQAVQASVAQQRLSLSPTDTLALAQLDQVEERAERMQEDYLQQLSQGGASGFFTKALRVDKAIQEARGQGPMDVANVCDFSDPELMRSSVYDKAVMYFIQNLNVRDEDQFSAAADTLMILSSRNRDCQAYMLDHLIDLFSTYGPESALQHMIDRYVVPLGNSAAIAPELRAKVDALMQVSMGRTAPELELNDREVITPLSEIVRKNRYTALFFYSSTCEHCHAQMPTLKIDRSKYLAKGFNVIGLALDVDSVDFLKSIEENTVPWKCYSEFKGWGARSAMVYLVKATPTFFLLDDKMKIIAKPSDAEELGKVLKGLYN